MGNDRPLILSCFPGIGLLDMAFELEGFTVVRGPDVIWGGDIRRFHPPADVFAGIIGGPPCQTFSPLAHLARARGYSVRFGNLIPEFERCVAEAAPAWFLMENVTRAPAPIVDRYAVATQLLNNVWLGEEQNRLRAISFGTRSSSAPPPALHIEVAALQRPVLVRTVTSTMGGRSHRRPTTLGPIDRSRQGRKATVTEGTHAVTSGSRSLPSQKEAAVYRETQRAIASQGLAAVSSAHGGEGKTVRFLARYPIAEALRLQGLPADFLDDAPFTVDGKRRAIANGVPLPMGRAIARAVKRAMGYELVA